jgi:hypothetical protein
VGGGSFPLIIGTEERGGGAVGMRSEKDLGADQCATEWIQKFVLLLTFLALQKIDVLLLTFLALQKIDDRIEPMISYIIGEMRQSRGFWWCCKDKITARELSLIIKLLNFREHSKNK